MTKKIIVFMLLVVVTCSVCGCTSKEKEAQIKAEQNTKAFTEGNKDLEKQDIPTKGTDKIGQSK